MVTRGVQKDRNVTIEGQTFLEVPFGAGRTNILIVYQNHRYLIETKVFSNNTLLKKGKDN